MKLVIIISWFHFFKISFVRKQLDVIFRTDKRLWISIFPPIQFSTAFIFALLLSLPLPEGNPNCSLWITTSTQWWRQQPSNIDIIRFTFATPRASLVECQINRYIEIDRKLYSPYTYSKRAYDGGGRRIIDIVIRRNKAEYKYLRKSSTQWESIVWRRFC